MVFEALGLLSVDVARSASYAQRERLVGMVGQLNCHAGRAKIQLGKPKVAARRRRPSVRHVNANFPNLKAVSLGNP